VFFVPSYTQGAVFIKHSRVLHRLARANETDVNFLFMSRGAKGAWTVEWNTDFGIRVCSASGETKVRLLKPVA
jgi:hypothetical protein